MPVCPACKRSSQQLAVICACKNAYTVNENSAADPGQRLGKIIADKYVPVSVVSINPQFTLYEAVQKPVERLVELQILSPDTVANKALRERYQTGAATFSAINHPNLTTVYELLQLPDGAIAISAELIRGKSLSSFKSFSEFDNVAITHIIHQALLAFAEVHSHNLSHPHISLNCIYLQKVGNDPYFVKVSKFSALNEAAGGERPAIAEDVLSLGNVLLKLLTETEPPYTNPELPPHRQLLAPLMPVLMRAVSAPAQRYKSAVEFLQEFESVLNISAPQQPARPISPKQSGSTPKVTLSSAPTFDNIAWLHLAPHPDSLK